MLVYYHSTISLRMILHECHIDMKKYKCDNVICLMIDHQWSIVHYSIIYLVYAVLVWHLSVLKVCILYFGNRHWWRRVTLIKCKVIPCNDYILRYNISDIIIVYRKVIPRLHVKIECITVSVKKLLFNITLIVMSLIIKH